MIVVIAFELVLQSVRWPAMVSRAAVGHKGFLQHSNIHTELLRQQAGGFVGLSDARWRDRKQE